MISLLSLDLNLILYKHEIIDYLIKNNLPYEIEKNRNFKWFRKFNC